MQQERGRGVLELTAIRMEVVAASGWPLKGWFDDGGNLERESAGEDESRQFKVRLKNLRYLRHRWVVVELRDTSTSRIGRWSVYYGGGGELERGRMKKGVEGRARLGFCW